MTTTPQSLDQKAASWRIKVLESELDAVKTQYQQLSRFTDSERICEKLQEAELRVTRFELENERLRVDLDTVTSAYQGLLDARTGFFQRILRRWVKPFSLPP